MSRKKEKEMTFKEGFAIYKRCLALIDKANPGGIQLDALRDFLYVINEYLSVYLAAFIIDAVSKGGDFKSMIIPAVVVCTIGFVIESFAAVCPRFPESREFSRQKKLQNTVSEKVMNMDYAAVENPETHQKLDKTLTQLSSNMTGLPVVERQTVYTLLGISYIVIGVILIAPIAFAKPVVTRGFVGFIQSVWGLITMTAVVILLEFFKATYINSKAVKVLEEIQQDDNITQARRIKSFYMGHVLQNYRNGKEIRIFGEQKLILDEFDKCHKVEVDGWTRGFKKCLLPNLSFQIINILTRILMYGFAVTRAMTGMLSAGDVVAFALYFTKIQAGISDVSDGIGLLKTTAVFCKQIFDFLDIPDEKYKGTIPTEKRDDNEYEFEFKHVWFKYPNSEQYVLKDINLKWRIGEKMALVGRNGCGKSTLVKLLCRLYDPTEGEITLNGIDIRKYKYEEYMDLFSVVFQDSKLFSFSLAENVAADTEYDPERVEDCVRRAGLSQRLDSMDNGIETCLYKDFDEQGVEISGGEAQKIMLARAIYKGAPFIVLDEPTAALDPISEHDIYTKFNSIVGTRTAIYISHRLSSCRFCDEITVMQDGRIAERGTHDKLLDDGGVYSALWAAQAEYYGDTARELFA
jgi:ATP-binding cassette subfamily B protein